MPVAVTNPALSSLQRILVYDIRIGDEAVNLTASELKQVDIGNVEGSHEYARITTQLTKTKIDRYVNKRISFTYGRRSRQMKFYGYVVSITPNQDYQQDTVVDIDCLGPTWVMQSGMPRLERNITAPNLFASVVTSSKYRLGAQVDYHEYLWPALAQSDESDWEFLLTLAMRVGYAVYNYQGVVRLVRPLRILQETPVFQSYIRADDVLDPTRSLLEWEATTQSLKLRENIKPAFGYFDGTVAATSPQVEGAPQRIRTDTPIRDRQMAAAYQQAWDNRIDYWNQQAVARINGDAKVVPGTNIAVQISGVQAGANDYDGVWMVRGVQHSLTHSTFQTQLDLARDSTRTPVNRNSAWFWEGRDGKVYATADGNGWYSQWGSHVVNAPEFIAMPTIPDPYIRPFTS